MTFKSSLMGFVAVACLSLYTFQAQGLRLVQIEQNPSYPYYAQDLFEANQLNAILFQLNHAKKTQKDLAEALEEQEYQEKRMAQIDECNTKTLEKYFKNAPEAWQNVKKAFLDQTKEMTLDFNASEPVNPNGTDEQMLAEALGTWRLGRDILIDLYANPEKYGEVKEGQSFPLWKDQEFLYDQQLTKSYDEINKYFGNLANNKPDFGDAKYNYRRAGDIQKKHAAYIEDLKKKYPDKAQGMPEAFNSALLPPKPLPPVSEIVQYIGNIEQTHQVYPEWPAPWKEFIESNFETYNLNGEMAQDFVPKSFNLNEKGTVEAQSGHDNRLNQIHTASITKRSADKIVKLQEDAKKQMDELLTQRFGIYNLKIENTDLLDEENFNAVAGQIKALKQQKIDIVKEKLAQYSSENINWEDDNTRKLADMQPHAQAIVLKKLPRGSQEYINASNVIKASKIKKDAEWISALEKDTNGVVPLAQANARYVDQLLNEAAANEALLEEVKKERDKNRDWLRNKELELACPEELMDAQ